MEKTVKIGSQDVKLNNNIGWALAYRDQFGRDIIPALMPLLAGVLDVFSGIITETGKTKDITVEDLIGVVDGDTLLDALIHLGSLELTDFINITWALAKCADESIPEPKEWVKRFEIFPVDVVAPAVIGLVTKGLVSSKNLKRLEELRKSLQPMKRESIQTPSSLQLSKED